MNVKYSSILNWLFIAVEFYVVVLKDGRTKPLDWLVACVKFILPRFSPYTELGT